MGIPLDGLSLARTAGVVAAFFVGVTVVVAHGLRDGARAAEAGECSRCRSSRGSTASSSRATRSTSALITATVTAALRFGAIRFGETSLARDCLAFYDGAGGFQVFYWFLHRAMHQRARVWMHRWHHRSQVTTPLTGLSMHPPRRLGGWSAWWACPRSRRASCPWGSGASSATTAFNTLGNVVGHANVEPTARFAATRNATWFANAFVYHAMHHARWNGHYAFQAALMDRLMGTEWSDWPALYERIASGRPLTSLQEKG
ncbi:MAG: sterol desaturase family protein [Polyangiales bacterium]